MKPHKAERALCRMYKFESIIAPNSNVPCARLALFGAQVTAARRQNKQKWRKKICFFRIQKYFLVCLILAGKFTSLQGFKIEIMTMRIRPREYGESFLEKGVLGLHITCV